MKILLRNGSVTLKMPGKNTSTVEVTHISSFGIWILVRETELFLSYDDFLWFKNTKISEILNVEEITSNHFHWPDLDVDLTTEIIENPKRFPLIASAEMP